MTKKNKRLLVLASLFTVVCLAIALILTALNSSVSYFYTPSDIASLSQHPTSLIRVGGLVENKSVRFDSNDKTRVVFSIKDEKANLTVSFEGVLPDLFREGQGVIVQGRLAESGLLVASEVLAKHDENYMPKELAAALKEQGRWQEGDQIE